MDVYRSDVRRWSRLSAVIILFCAFVWSFEGRAQDAGSGSNDFSLFGGYMLPNQIDGVTEILPIFGARYALGFPVGALEFEGENAHAQGVDWTSFGLNLRAEIPVMHGMSGMVYGGPDFHYYTPVGDTGRRADYGVHGGVAALMLVTDGLWVRSDLKFMGNPGTALYITFGLMFRTIGAGN